MTDKNCDEISADLETCKTEVGQQIELLRLEALDMRADVAGIREDMSEILEVWRDGEGFVKIVRVVGRIMIWAATVAATASGIVYAITHFGGQK